MPPSAPSRRPVRTLCAALALFALAACGGSPAYRESNALFAEGRVEQGLARLEAAVLDEPSNAEYRIALLTRRASLINRLLANGEAARREGRLNEAEQAYRQAAAIDAHNAMARQGLEQVAAERRQRQAFAEAETIFKGGTPSALAEAAERLRAILAANPAHKDAQRLKARIDEQRAREERPELRLAARFREPISLEFRDAPLKSVLEVVARSAGLNFFYDRDIRADLRTTIFARDTTIEDALRIVLATNQLEQKILNDNSLLIYPNTPQKVKDYQTLAVRSFYLTNADVKAVANTLKTIGKAKDIVVDERLGIIIMRDTPEAIRMAERIVALQDLSDPEVMLEVEIMEVKRSRLVELGVQWPTQLELAPLRLPGVPLTLDALRNITSATTQATIGSMIISAHKDTQEGNILANPRIRVRNKEKARVQIGDRVPVITTTSTATGFVSESVAYLDVGLKLEVEPNIYLDEEVAIKINLEVSNLVREIVSKSGTLSYQIGTRGANTVLRLKDGETQILAGLISDEDRSSSIKVPGLGDLPIVGRLFGSQKDDVGRSEILLSITPHIVRSIRRPDMLAAEFESGTESSVGTQLLRLSAPARPAAPAVLAPPPPAPELPSAPMSPPALGLSWQAPAQVRVGEQFSVGLEVSSEGALSGMSTLLAYDAQALQVVSVAEGGFFRDGSVPTTFSERVDADAGRVLTTSLHYTDAETAAGVKGSGSIVGITFKALRPSSEVKLQLLTATPQAAAALRVALPPAHSLSVVP